ncbi:MAG: SdrD B-like domain-containing protein [Saprospiraceae bacterium]|nr:SdrD B-like domain-containing protein [Saprospiraceae bacterium]
MKSIQFKYILFAVFIILAGCRKDEKIDDPIIIDPPSDPTIEVVSGVTGLVIDEDGNPVTDAKVDVYNRQVTTDENGIFYVNNVGLNRSNSHVKVSKSGYFDGLKSFIPALGKKSYVQLQLVKRDNPYKIIGITGGSIDIPDGPELIFPTDAFVLKGGSDAYGGEVNVYVHWYDPTDPDLGLSMPGNLLGITSDGSEAQLGTYGMIAAELETTSGQALQLAEGKKAVLKFPVPASLDPPSTIPLWSFDDIDMVWIQEGVAKLEENEYVGEVSHFSFWNCDAPFPLINLEGRLVNNGSPLSNLGVIITVSNVTSGYGMTDSEGIFRGKVPKGELLLLTIWNCGETIVVHEIGPFDTDQNVGDIEVELLNFVATIEGRLVDCFDQPLENAYGLIKVEDNVRQVVTTQSDGTFSATIAGCTNKEYTVQFFDPEELNASSEIDIEKNEEIQELGDIRVCEGLDEFIKYTVDGVQAQLITEANVFISNENKLIIRGNNPGVWQSFDLDVFATTEGGYNPSTVAVRGDLGPNNPELAMMCGDHLTNYFTCDQFDVQILSFAEYVTGTFSGILVAQGDSLQTSSFQFEEFAVEGSFRVKIDDNITTGEISGQFWFDENGNNTREDDEDLSMEVQYVTLRRTSGSNLPLFPTFLYAYTQSYKFTDVEPGTYEVGVYGNSGYTLVTKDVGGDDRDSDFGEGTNNLFLTDDITISTDEIIENVDLGYVLPTSVSCGNIFYNGCAPEIYVSANISGGVPPYTATLNGTQSVMFEDAPVFTIEEGGIYSMEVVDAIGNICTSETVSINSYNNSVQGTIWRDVEGGTPNVYDGNDIRLSDIAVILHEEGGAIAGGTQSQNGFYNITNIAPGNYYIELDVPGALQIVDLNTGVNLGNDIDPATGRSAVFTIGDCNTFERVDGGFKPN